MYFLDDLDEEDYEIAIKVSEILSITQEPIKAYFIIYFNTIPDDSSFQKITSAS